MRTYKICNIDATVTTCRGLLPIIGKAIGIRGDSIKVRSSDFMRPGTDVDTVLSLAQPRRLRGRVDWVVAQTMAQTMDGAASEVVYEMGICLDVQRGIGDQDLHDFTA